MSETSVRYAQLPELADTGERHAWDVWGRDDELGSINRLGPEQVLAAAAAIRTGEVVSLNLDLSEPAPGLFPSRTPPTHTVVRTSRGRDDRIDGFYPQFSTQWDGLRHVRFRRHGFWGGRQDADIDTTDALGIDRWSEHGIVGRGVLVDAATRLDLTPNERRAIGSQDLQRILDEENVRLRPGDLLLLRTGWLQWYRSLPPAERERLTGTIGHAAAPLACPGLDAARDTAAWLWDHGIAAVAADNPALEALPVQREVGFLHYRLIPLLGIAVGELWNLDRLAQRCAELGRYEFLLSASPLPVTAGVGSPANAYAIL